HHLPNPPTPPHHTLSLHDALPIFRSSQGTWTRSAGSVSVTWKASSRSGPIRMAPGTASSLISPACSDEMERSNLRIRPRCKPLRSEEHTSELQSRGHLVCRLLLVK